MRYRLDDTPRRAGCAECRAVLTVHEPMRQPAMDSGGSLEFIMAGRQVIFTALRKALEGDAKDTWQGTYSRDVLDGWHRLRLHVQPNVDTQITRATAEVAQMGVESKTHDRDAQTCDETGRETTTITRTDGTNTRRDAQGDIAPNH